MSSSVPWTVNQKEAQGIYDYVVKSSGKNVQGDVKLTLDKSIQRDKPFVKVFKESEIIKAQ